MTEDPTPSAQLCIFSHVQHAQAMKNKENRLRLSRGREKESVSGFESHVSQFSVLVAKKRLKRQIAEN